jgi:hypothetical protein
MTRCLKQFWTCGDLRFSLKAGLSLLASLVLAGVVTVLDEGVKWLSSYLKIKGVLVSDIRGTGF